MKSYKIDELAKFIIEYCKYNKLNKVYICGNGGSGKTTLSKKIEELSLKYGNINIIATDDFLVDTTLRKNAINKWNDNNIIYEGRYTTSNIESYYLKNIYELIYNIDHNIDCYYFPKRYKEKNKIKQLNSNYFLTIIEGVGTYFLEKDFEKSLTILLKCSKEDEILRRKIRTETLNRDIIELYDKKRASQYKVNILSHENEFDLVIVNDKEFNYKIENIKNGEF